MRFVLLRTRLLTRTLGPIPALGLVAWLVLVALGGPATAAASDLQTAGSLCIGLLPIAVAVATILPYPGSGPTYLPASTSLIVFSAHAILGGVCCWLLSLCTRDVAAQAPALMAAGMVFFPPVAIMASLTHLQSRWVSVSATVFAFTMQCILFAPSLQWEASSWLALLLECLAAALLIAALRPGEV